MPGTQPLVSSEDLIGGLRSEKMEKGKRRSLMNRAAHNSKILMPVSRLDRPREEVSPIDGMVPRRQGNGYYSDGELAEGLKSGNIPTSGNNHHGTLPCEKKGGILSLQLHESVLHMLTELSGQTACISERGMIETE